ASFNQTCYSVGVKASLIIHERIRSPRARVGVIAFGLLLLPSLSYGSEYCTKEQYEHDRAFIESALAAGTLAKGPKGLRESMLVHEGFWFDMNYPEQIAFMQRFECAAAGLSGKHFLYMDVRSLANGRLLATWTLGQLKPVEGSPITPTEPGNSESVDENHIGLTGEARTAFINSALDACNKSSPTFCSCYANAMADSLSMAELKQMSTAGNEEDRGIAFRPKLEAAARRCRTN